ncbi:MAG: hypothetical protein IPH58_06520 [Sphingobacteriales bacterium]|jgi:hypothetical protein|nr:hypothetical protein [Sphingobacteriales bacterium]
MNPISILRIFLLFSVVFIVSCSKKAVDSVYPTDITEAREWLRENGGVFKKGELQIILRSGKKITGILMWEEAKRLSYKGRDYIDIPYVFPRYEKILPGGENMPPVSYNLVLRKNKKGQYEGALRTTQYGVMAENLTIGGENAMVLQSYHYLDGRKANMWMGEVESTNLKSVEEVKLTPSEIANMREAAKISMTQESNTQPRRLSPVCQTYYMDVYETSFFYASRYDESIGNVTIQRIHRTVTSTICTGQDDYNDNYYPPVVAGGGGGNSTPSDSEYPYECSCNCGGSEPEMADASTVYEPKWGQLGSKSDIVSEVKYAKGKIPTSSSFEKQLENLRNYFEKNRMWGRNESGELIELSTPDAAINRYVYTENRGWIDMHHLFYASFLAEKHNNSIQAEEELSLGEWIQWLKKNESAFSYEDQPSNKAGIEFWRSYKGYLKDGSMTIDIAVDDFLYRNGAKDPAEAPNYDYIPHIINNKYPKNFTGKGYTGEILKQKARESYCSKSITQQNNIREAHQKLPASAPKKN